jgi:hypothetical protein
MALALPDPAPSSAGSIGTGQTQIYPFADFSTAASADR